MEMIYGVGIVGFLALAYTYLIYPLLMWLWAKVGGNDACVCKEESIDPREVAVVISVYNEEKFLRRRVEQLLKLKYGTEVLIAVGSDGSTDETNRILEELGSKYNNVNAFFFPRRGKASTINDLVRLLPENIKYIVLTDVKTFSDSNAIEVLVSALRDEDAGIAMPWVKVQGSNEGIYFDMEIRLKCYESLVVGYCAGAFGNMYAMKRNLYVPIPENFVVDDLFVTLQVVMKGYRTKVCRNTSSYVVPTNVLQEFLRRRRIAAGNWQIVKWLIIRIFKFPLSFLFVLFSHKLLRWLGPVWLLGIIISLVGLTIQIPIIGIALLLVLSVIYLTKTLRNLVVRFLVLNAGLLMGFFDFLFKKQRGVWNPTKREITL